MKEFVLERVHVHGASVTAQATPGGFFSHMERLWQQTSSPPVVFTRSAFGASHFNDAGFHFLADIFLVRPDVCFIEWTTTSAKGFDRAKTDAMTCHLLAHGILPVWVTFPRADDPQASRQTILDAKSIAAQRGVPVLDLAAQLSPSMLDNHLLRDTVHTTEAGGVSYASHLVQWLTRTHSFVRQMTASAASAGLSLQSLLPVPSVHSCSSAGALKARLEGLCRIRFRCLTGRVEFCVQGSIGPHSPIVRVCIQAEAGRVVYETERCLFDPWCYYERKMVLPIVATSLDEGDYQLTVEVLDLDPTNRVTLRQQPASSFSGKRYMQVDRYTCLNMEFVA